MSLIVYPIFNFHKQASFDNTTRVLLAMKLSYFLFRHRFDLIRKFKWREEDFDSFVGNWLTG